ncbi:methylmalonyl-CoA mutase family protein [Candidatus Riflebacteria bacterium]
MDEKKPEKNISSSRNRGFLDEFSKPEYETWLQLVAEQLKGAPFEKKLVKKICGDIKIQPIFRENDCQKNIESTGFPGVFPFVRGNNYSGNILTSWEICQAQFEMLPAAFNEVAQKNLANGQNALNIKLHKSSMFGIEPKVAAEQLIGDGLSLYCLEDLEKALDGIDITKIAVHIDAGTFALPVAGLLTELLEKRGIAVNSISGSISLDPFATIITDGIANCSLSQLFDEMAFLTGNIRKELPGLQTIGVNVFPYAESGADAAMELALAMATAVEYLKQMHNRDIPIEQCAQAIRFSFAVGPDFFVEIAKLRAARQLWGLVLKSFNLPEQASKMRLHATTSLWNKTKTDPHVNILRSTTEAFSAIAGGCNSLTVLPFDRVDGQPEELALRIARNVQVILRDESHAGRTIDPAGGSWYVEVLTGQLAEKAWEVFQSIQEKGGIDAVLQSGWLHNKLEEAGEERLKRFYLRKDVAIGTSIYPNLDEKIFSTKTSQSAELLKQRQAEIGRYIAARDTEELQKELQKFKQVKDWKKWATPAIQNLVKMGATTAEIGDVLRDKTTEKIELSPLPAKRRSVEYEKLRENALAYKKRTGKLPQIFLANLGTLQQYKIRADFSSDFFKPGGFAIISGKGHDNLNATIEEALSSGAGIIVLCSQDEIYRELVPSFARKIKEKMPQIHLLLAGRPKDDMEKYSSAGVDDYIFLGANNLELLKSFQKKIGVSA